MSSDTVTETEDATPRGPRARYAAARDGLRSVPRSAQLALASLFIVNGATYVAYPLLAVKLADVDHLSAGRIGLVLTAFLVAARLLPMIGGPIADRYDPRAVMMVGAIARGIGFVGLGLLHDQWLFLGAAVLAGSGAIFEAPVSGLFAALPEPTRSRAFALENAVLNASVIGGPALAALLLRFGTQIPFVCSGVLFLLVSFTVLAIEPPAEHSDAGRSALAHARTALRNRTFVLFWVLMLPWWFLFTQLGVALPIRSNAVAGVGWIALVYIVMGVAGLAALPFVKKTIDRIGPRRSVAVGFLAVAVGLGSIGFSTNRWWLLACVCGYMFGETAVLYASQLIIAGFAGARTRASYFGLYAGSWAVGGGVGNFLGAYLTTQPLTATAWLVFGAVGIAGSAAFSAVFLTRRA
ncbi:MAG TPA: MFS transporter [Actinospica sp.]|nr:MFS transporter [Actinospica sp.]